MDSRRALFRAKAPYDLAGTEGLFCQAVRENCKFHQAHCPEYRAILKGVSFSPDDLTEADALADLPALPTTLFKGRRLFSLPEEKLHLKATSSGTSGSASQIGMGSGDMARGLRMVWRMGRRHKLFSPVPTHYVVLGYEPHKSNTAAAAKTALGATLLAPALERTYALHYQEGAGYVPDLDGVVAALKRYAASRFPTRLVGFPAYAYFALKLLDEAGMRLRLPTGSRLILGGGWKQFGDQQVEKEELFALAERCLGLREEGIREVFSTVEHPVLYCACPRHHFHVPVYSRVLIRDVDTLKPLPMGQPGLLNLITPMLDGVPALSVITDDLAVLRPGEDCGCGIQAPYFELLGRVGMKQIKTCAAGAAELLGEGKP